jgi:TM2 domain-containing membrane protein YozV
MTGDEFDFGTTQPPSQRNPGTPKQLLHIGPRAGPYIVLAFLGGAFGVHNFYANRPLRGCLQAIASVAYLLVLLYFNTFQPEMLASHFFIWFPFLMLVWVIYDVATVQTDGGGNPLRSGGQNIRVIEDTGDTDLDSSSGKWSRALYIVLALTVGPFGVHNFYALRPVRALLQLALGVMLTCALFFHFWVPLPAFYTSRILLIWIIVDVLDVRPRGSDKKLSKADRVVRTSEAADQDNELDFGSTASLPQRRYGPSRVMYILLAIMFGTFGVHNFYASRSLRACLQLSATVLYLALVVVVEYGLNMRLPYYSVLIPEVVLIWVAVDIFTVRSSGRGIRMK